MMHSIHDDRLELIVDSTCSIFSRSKQKWYEGTVSKIWLNTNTNQEWLIVKYGNNKSKQIQRFCEDLRTVPLLQEPSFGWDELKPPPFDVHSGNQYSNIVPINAMEYCVASEMILEPVYTNYNSDGCDNGGIYVYSVIVNDWMLLREYPKHIPFMKSSKLSLAFNPRTSDLYIYGVHENALWSVVATLNVYSRKFKYIICKTYLAGIGATAMVIDGVFHLIGGAVSNLHAIFNAETNSFDNRYPIWNNDSMHNMNGGSFISGNQQHRVVYIPSQHMLWVLGGSNGVHNACKQIWCHELSPHNGYIVWTQSFATLPCKMSSMGCCLCYDRWIISLGGKSEYNIHDIYIMDINNDVTFDNMSTLELPDDCCSYNTVVLPLCPVYDAHLMVTGFIKNNVCKGYDAFVAMGIIDLIFSFSRTEYIYVMQNNKIKPKQWRICVNDILNSMKPITSIH